MSGRHGRVTLENIMSPNEISEPGDTFFVRLEAVVLNPRIGDNPVCPESEEIPDRSGGVPSRHAGVEAMPPGVSGQNL